MLVLVLQLGHLSLSDDVDVQGLVYDFIAGVEDRGGKIGEVTEEEVLALLLTMSVQSRTAAVGLLIDGGVPRDIAWMGYWASEGFDPGTTPLPEPTPPGVPPPRPTPPPRRWPWMVGAIALGVVGFAVGTRYGRRI